MRLFWVWFTAFHSVCSIAVPLNRLILDKNLSVLVVIKNGWVTFFVQMEHEGYLAMGLANGMEKGIVFLIEFQDGIPRMSDCQLIGKRRPRCSKPLEPIYNLDEYERLESGAWRAIIRADYNADFEVPINSNVNLYSAAYGHSSLLAYHGQGEGMAISFSAEFRTPIFEPSTTPSTPTDPSNSTTPNDGNQNNTIPINQTTPNITNSTINSTDPGESIELPASNDTNPTNGTLPIVRTINPSRYRTKEYLLQAVLLNASMLGYLILSS